MITVTVVLVKLYWFLAESLLAPLRIALSLWMKVTGTQPDEHELAQARMARSGWLREVVRTAREYHIILPDPEDDEHPWSVNSPVKLSQLMSMTWRELSSEDRALLIREVAFLGEDAINEEAGELMHEALVAEFGGAQ